MRSASSGGSDREHEDWEEDEEEEQQGQQQQGQQQQGQGQRQRQRQRRKDEPGDESELSDSGAVGLDLDSPPAPDRYEAVRSTVLAQLAHEPPLEAQPPPHQPHQPQQSPPRSPRWMPQEREGQQQQQQQQQPQQQQQQQRQQDQSQSSVFASSAPRRRRSRRGGASGAAASQYMAPLSLPRSASAPLGEESSITCPASAGSGRFSPRRVELNLQLEQQRLQYQQQQRPLQLQQPRTLMTSPPSAAAPLTRSSSSMPAFSRQLSSQQSPPRGVAEQLRSRVRRPNSARELSSGDGALPGAGGAGNAYMVFNAAPALGELSTGTVTSASQVGVVCSASVAVADLHQLALAGDSRAVALLDAIEALDRAGSGLEARLAALRYVTELLPPALGLRSAPPSPAIGPAGPAALFLAVAAASAAAQGQAQAQAHAQAQVLVQAEARLPRATSSSSSSLSSSGRAALPFSLPEDAPLFDEAFDDSGRSLEELARARSPARCPPERAELYVVSRVALAQVDVLFQIILEMLLELSGHLSFWADLEDSPLRCRITLWGRAMWREARRWVRRQSLRGAKAAKAAAASAAAAVRAAAAGPALAAGPGLRDVPAGAGSPPASRRGEGDADAQAQAQAQAQTQTQTHAEERAKAHEQEQEQEEEQQGEEEQQPQSVAAIIAQLEELQELQLGYLGQLKATLLAFEELESVDSARDLAYSCTQQVRGILGMSSDVAPPDTDGRLDALGLLAYCREFLGALAERRRAFRREVRGLEEVPRAIKYWPELCAGTLVGLGALAWGLARKGEALDLIERVRYSWSEFYTEHLRNPLAALVDEIVYDHTLAVASPQAVVDAKESLARMLRDYVKDTEPGMDAQALDSLVGALDVSVLSRRYEAEMKKPITSLVSGDLVRMLLLQLQFMKKELLVVMTSLDELIRENQFNLEVLAIIPAALVTWSTYQLGVQIMTAVRGTRSSKAYVFAQLRLTLRDVEQLLNLNSHDKKLLGGVSLGRLVLLLHQLEKIVVSNTEFFDRHERKRLAEDVSELLADHLSMRQKLNTVSRMHRCYAFLQPSSRSLEALLRRLL